MRDGDKNHPGDQDKIILTALTGDAFGNLLVSHGDSTKLPGGWVTGAEPKCIANDVIGVEPC